MKFFILTLVAGIGCFSAAYAQERTAGTAADAKMTWSALSSSVKVVGDRVETVNNRVNESVVCGKKNMVYAPDAVGADAQDCVYAGLSPSTTTIINNMNVCARSGAVYNDTTKDCVQPDKPRWYYVGTTASVAGIAACSGAKGNVARLCTTVGERCYKTTTSTSTSAQTCKETGDTGGWEGCWGGGTTTTTTRHVYSCE